MSSARVLVIGYGNPGRLDDGLGPALARELAQHDVSPLVTVDSGYQLEVEDAHAAAAHDIVIFVDAAVDGAEPYYVAEVAPRRGPPSFSSHSLLPCDILGLARDLFDARTRGFVVGIRGYEFNEFGERLSRRAQANLAEAQQLLREVLAVAASSAHVEHVMKTLTRTGAAA